MPHPEEPRQEVSRSVQHFFCKHTSQSLKEIQKISKVLIDVGFTFPYLLVLTPEITGGPQVEKIKKAEWMDMGKEEVLWLLLTACEIQSMQMKAVKA